jgi:ATP-binding cassette subfamily B multidrug efflux pump
MLSFRMKYYDNAPVGQLVTRSVSDIEAIARIFSQGLFMIISDLMKMLVVLMGFMFYMNWKLTWIVIVAMPFWFMFTRIFQRKCKSLLKKYEHKLPI